MTKASRSGAGVLVVLVLACVMATAQAARAAITDPVFAPLVRELKTGGRVPPATVDRWFADSHTKFEGRLMVSLLAKSEYTLDYGQFLEPKRVAAARDFARKHRTDLKSMRRAYGVDPAVVVAILAVETNLGSYTGRWSIFNVLASQAVLDTPEGLRRLARDWPQAQKATLGDAAFKERLRKRAVWARDELVALYQLCRAEKCDPRQIKGSLAGAIGWPQFVPSSVLQWGADADGDGRRELHQAKDAIHSVGQYLSAHGWRPGLSRPQQTEVLLTYNKSRPYARTVLDLAGKLR